MYYITSQLDSITFNPLCNGETFSVDCWRTYCYSETGDELRLLFPCHVEEFHRGVIGTITFHESVFDVSSLDSQDRPEPIQHSRETGLLYCVEVQENLDQTSQEMGPMCKYRFVKLDSLR